MYLENSWSKAIPVEKAIKMLQAFPKGCLITTNSVGNLVVLDKDHKEISYIDLGIETSEKF